MTVNDNFPLFEMNEAEQQFIEITNSSIDDAQRFLSITDNQVEHAIQLYFLNAENPQDLQNIPNIPAPIVLEPQETPSVEEEISQDHNSSYDPAGGEPSVDEDIDDQQMDYQAFEHLLQNPGFHHRQLEDLMHHANSQFMPQSRQSNELFPPPAHLIHQLPIDRAQQIANAQSKWIFLIISNPQEFVCQQINRDLLSDDFIQEILNNFYVVYYLQNTPLSEQFKQLYPFPKPPYICIIDPRTGERVRQYKSVHSLMKVDVSEWAVELTSFLEEYDLNKSFIQTISKQEKRVDEMTEEEQIELALQESMGAPKDSKDLTINNDQGHFSTRLTPKEIEVEHGVRVAIRLPSISYH
eukprot:NODE_100_length_20777_cov_0.240884.p2 type:complete len:353 gc:universal NODE_100_length_20777_cov_0.240884:15902-16960(+)